MKRPLEKYSTAIVYLVILGFVVWALWPWSRAANRFDAGLKAAQAGEYPTAVRYWEPLAAEGHALARYNLGVLYEQGKGVPADPRKAAQLYGQAAAEDIPLAKVNLGLMYINGNGVERNQDKGSALIQDAARGGEPRALYNLGNMYLHGIGVPRDLETAVASFRAAAERGHHRAQFRLAERYRLGEGVAADAVEAYAWYAQSARSDDETGEKARTMLQQMTAAMRGEALSRARRRANSLKESLPTSSDRPWPLIARE